MFKIELQWKEFNVDLSALDQQLRASYPSYQGNQAHNVLELWFSEELSEEQKQEIESMWAGINSAQHSLAQSYKSASQIEADKASKKASAMSKLAALGLSQDELKAILG